MCVSARVDVCVYACACVCQFLRECVVCVRVRACVRARA